MSGRPAVAVVLVGAALALACASGPPRPRGTAGLPPIAPGLARLVLYHTNDTDVTLFHPMLTLDGEPLGELPVGTFLYADRPPGLHELGVKPQPNFSAFGGQAPTQPISVMLLPAETSYVQFGVLATPVWVNSSLTPMDPATAQRYLAALTLAAPPAAE